MQCYRSFTSIKAMTFDLDDTLYDNAPIIKQAEATLLTKLREAFPKTAELTARQWQQIKQQLISEDPRLASDMTALRTQSLYRALAVESLTESQRHNAAQELCAHFYAARSAFKVSADYTSVLATLAQKIPLIAITNGNVDTATIGIADYFQTSLHASLLRPKKPHPHMFEEAIKHLKLAPHNILHVGDSLINDVLGAHRVGMHTAWYACNRTMQLNAEPVAILPSIQLRNFADLLCVTGD